MFMHNKVHYRLLSTQLHWINHCRQLQTCSDVKHCGSVNGTAD